MFKLRRTRRVSDKIAEILLEIDTIIIRRCSMYSLVNFKKGILKKDYSGYLQISLSIKKKKT